MARKPKVPAPKAIRVSNDIERDLLSAQEDVRRGLQTTNDAMSPRLLPTDVKIGTYRGLANEMVRFDTSQGPFTIGFPSDRDHGDRFVVASAFSGSTNELRVEAQVGDLIEELSGSVFTRAFSMPTGSSGAGWSFDGRGNWVLIPGGASMTTTVTIASQTFVQSETITRQTELITLGSPGVFIQNAFLSIPCELFTDPFATILISTSTTLAAGPPA